MQLGCCVPIEKYELAAALGYDYAELPAWEVQLLEPRQLEALLERMEKTRLPVPRLNAYCGGVPAIVGEGVNDESTRAYARSLMKKAAALGVATIGIGAPSARVLPSGFDPHEADRQCERFLRITAEEAAPYHITLLLESIHSGACSYINRLSQAADMVRRVNLPQVRLMADLYHMDVQGEPFALLAPYAQDIRHVHVSTAGEGLARGLYGAKDAAACAEAFRAIQSIGYDGTVSIEPDASALSEESMKTALEIMRRSCRQTG